MNLPISEPLWQGSKTTGRKAAVKWDNRIPKSSTQSQEPNGLQITSVSLISIRQLPTTDLLLIQANFGGQENRANEVNSISYPILWRVANLVPSIS